MAEDFRWTIIGTTKFSGTYQGKQVVIDKLLTPLIAQLDGPICVTADRFIAEDDYVMQGHGTATTKTGKPYNNTYCMVWRIAQGKFEEMTEHLDTELAPPRLARRRMRTPWTLALRATIEEFVRDTCNFSPQGGAVQQNKLSRSAYCHDIRLGKSMPCAHGLAKPFSDTSSASHHL